MKFIETEIEGLVIIEPSVFEDERGYFFESFREDLFEQKFPGIKFIQENESLSSYGVLRGLHYQLHPFAQSKLVRVVAGKVLDVAVDIRKSSPTFGKYISVMLSSENKKQLFIPRGFAHGFVVLSESAIFNYKVDNYYNHSFEKGIHFKTPYLNIDWKLEQSKVTVSSKDNNLTMIINEMY